MIRNIMRARRIGSLLQNRTDSAAKNNPDAGRSWCILQEWRAAPGESTRQPEAKATMAPASATWPKASGPFLSFSSWYRCSPKPAA